MLEGVETNSVMVALSTAMASGRVSKVPTTPEELSAVTDPYSSTVPEDVTADRAAT